MIINIKNDNGEVQYDVNKIADEDKKRGATVTISKVGSLETIIEALQFASSTPVSYTHLTLPTKA